MITGDLFGLQALATGLGRTDAAASTLYWYIGYATARAVTD